MGHERILPAEEHNEGIASIIVDNKGVKLRTPLFWRDSYINQFSSIENSTLYHDGSFWKSPSDIDQKWESPLLTFSSDGIKYYSPLSATFGGIFKGASSSTTENELLGSLIRYLIENQVSEIEITLPPNHLNYDYMVSLDTYLAHGFELSYSNVNHYISLHTWDHQKLSKGNRKKLRQAKELELEFATSSGDDVKLAYEVIAKNRESLGSKVSLELNKLMELMNSFPDEYSCYLLKSKSGDIAAAAFLVETSQDNIYVYLWADEPHFRGVSPLVLLLDYLVTKVQDRFTYLDLGTSAINGVALDGLVRFKTNLGAAHSHKSTIRWQNPSIKTKASRVKELEQ